jgi:hypothetical protein
MKKTSLKLANEALQKKDYLSASRKYLRVSAQCGEIGKFVKFNYYYSLRKHLSSISDKPFSQCHPLQCLNLRGDETNAFSAIQNFIEEAFAENPSYLNYLVVLGYNLSDVTPDELREKFPGRKIVAYQLEQLSSPDNLWFNEKHKLTMVRTRTKRIKKWLSESDEIWDYDICNIRFLEKNGYANVYHVPIGYTSVIDRDHDKIKKDIDILFYGSINKRRADILSKIPKNINLKIIGNYSQIPENEVKSLGIEDRFLSKEHVFGSSLNDYVDRSNFVLNIHYYEGCIQEQARLFELLSNNINVISERSEINYYGNLIKEVEYEKLRDSFSEVYNESLVRKEIKLNFSKKIRRPYRICANYSTFYGAKLLKTSIESLRPVVDYVVVIHQKVSFSGIEHSEEDWNILLDLKKHGYIDDLVIFDLPKGGYDNPTTGMVDKRNLGLEYAKRNACDYVVTLDADECYSAKSLSESIEYMSVNNYDTMYSPILAYYGDKNHYFKDTYFVPSVYRVGVDRIYRKTQTTVLCDPSRKMREASFFIAENNPMHHLTYLPEEVGCKIDSKVINSNPEKRKDFMKIYEHLKTWKPGEPALVFRNPEGKGADVELGFVDLMENKDFIF